MNSQGIVSAMNSYLHEATTILAIWLDNILPKVTTDWWDECVIANLSYVQRERAKNAEFNKLSDFDLAVLLRIANKAWYDMRSVAYLPTEERTVIRNMMDVRNNWAHCSAELPGKDTIIRDLKTLITFIRQINGNEKLCSNIDEFIEEIEKPDSVNFEKKQTKIQSETVHKNTHESEINVNSLVYVIAEPNKRGIVRSLSNLGSVIKYDVFINGKNEIFYTGQIAAADVAQTPNRIDIKTARSYLTAYQILNPSSKNLYSLNSARIDFVPYQFRPALKMMKADEPRILIADSVGVGKTIEAGLIIKELDARNPLECVLIICPRPLVSERKWELEMKRFDEEFLPVDGGTLRRIITDTDRDGEWPRRYNKIIIPYSIFDNKTYNGDIKNGWYGLKHLDPNPHFDLVIVDEAHHIRNGSMDKDKAFAYKCTKYFCDNADAVVMLTATPLQTSNNDLFSLLNVLRPDVIIDTETFEMMSQPNAYISKAVQVVRKNENDWHTDAKQLLLDVRKTQWGDNVISENPLYDDIILRLDNSNISREHRVKLISDIESLHSFDTLINRTRRKDIQDFCIRRTSTISTEFTPYQQKLHDKLLNFEQSALSTLHDPRKVPFMISMLKRQAASCIFGLAPFIKLIINKRIQQLNDDVNIEYGLFDIDGESGDMISVLANEVIKMTQNLPKEDPKFDQMLKIIKDKNNMNNNKIMIFSTFRYTLAYLKEKLTNEGYRVEQIDGSVRDEIRYSFKTRFELPKDDKNAIDILLFTEVGSEGIDYQFCDFMINYDLPWNPMKIEQRIGRIDRRGQSSEVVNIYNVITENTVDADIYYRCLMRIGVFENSIGECETILGELSKEIENIIYDNTLTDEERKNKLEQIADNEIRKIQELNKLEDEEKGLFGFDLTGFTTAQEIKKAENPWINQWFLQKMIEQYLNKLLGEGNYIHGESANKYLRLSATARGKLKDDYKKIISGRNFQKKEWESYLSGKKPNHMITFDPDTASKNRDSFFITPMHPLAKQAAKYFENYDAINIKISYKSNLIPSGTYPFSVYAWKYTGFNEYTRIVTICDNDIIQEELPALLEQESHDENVYIDDYDWNMLEEKHVGLWINEREKHRSDMKNILNFKLESIANNKTNKLRSLERKIEDSTNESIIRMHTSELEKVKEIYECKANEITSKALNSDIFATLLMNGVVVVEEV